ncbi:unnamed protein product (macronuclear) [Paramecium tetraurelia]|uniref:Transmembrane protein n=1 Tax=Paramecium tetraurelia TaxID=5888 RepID=A0DMW1_PARTE|nr:uncharacterized protein GSPATT00018583001 [Paramecium tetraurelia]CAK84378.1 unnamed protein product [Paramecium tetraurelia]|eukprot:XP_001451775.1 hypothetical protein (macronuclear) [Paramecium tetraurelia strain d4-2]
MTNKQIQDFAIPLLIVLTSKCKSRNNCAAIKYHIRLLVNQQKVNINELLLLLLMPLLIMNILVNLIMLNQVNAHISINEMLKYIKKLRCFLQMSSSRYKDQLEQERQNIFYLISFSSFKKIVEYFLCLPKLKVFL